MVTERTDRATTVEMSWFAALCDDDAEYLGVADPALASSYAHCRDIVLAAETAGFDMALLPSGYSLGIDTMTFAAAMAPQLRRLKLLAAIRCGEMWPPQQARQIASLDRMLEGRLAINIISSPLPGEELDAPARYARTREAMGVMRGLLAGEAIRHEGEFYRLALDPPRVRPVSPSGPLFYFGGLSEEARETAADGADVYLMWPDQIGMVAETIADLRARAARRGRTLRFGYRVHVVVRETEAEARDAADRLLNGLDARAGEALRARALDSGSAGVQRQAELRGSASGDGYVEDNLWTGIGRARSGCGAAIVGDPDQVLRKLDAYRALDIDAFILSGYPHAHEADLFGRYVLPGIAHRALGSSRAQEPGGAI